MRVSNNQGFTLVELLIVVAIIGVLTTIGIPSFRKMIAKSRKAEAKMALGGIFTAETAFHATYGIYTNNLDAIGFDVEGGVNSFRRYTIGFPANGANCGTSGVVPPVLSPPAPEVVEIERDFPTYMTGRTIIRRTFPGASELCFTSGVPFSVTPVMAGAGWDDAYNFVAGATGAISPEAQPDSAVTGGTGPFQDVWVITNNRQLANVTDGTN